MGLDNIEVGKHLIEHEILKQNIKILVESLGIDHTKLTIIGTNTHAQIDTAITNSVNHIADGDKHVSHSGVSILAGTGMSGGGTIEASRTLNCSITQYTDALARASISETVPGLTYTSATGVLSLTEGYVIPTTTQETNWNTAFSWGNHAGLYLPIAGKAADTDLFDGMDSLKFVYGATINAASSAPATWASPHFTQWHASFWDIVGADWTPTESWYWGITLPHTSNNDGYNYGGQFIFENGYDNLYFRKIEAGTPTTWRRLWHSGDDVFLLNTGDTATGTYNFDSNTFVIDSVNHRVGIGTATPSFKLDVTGRIRSTLGRVPANILNLNYASEGEVFAALAPSVPVVGDMIILSGSFWDGYYLYSVSYAERIASGQIAVYRQSPYNGYIDARIVYQGSETEVGDVLFSW